MLLPSCSPPKKLLIIFSNPKRAYQFIAISLGFYSRKDKVRKKKKKKEIALMDGQTSVMSSYISFKLFRMTISYYNVMKILLMYS
jgi:hypothetical protein